MSSEANNDAAESPATASPGADERASDGVGHTAEQALPSIIIDPSASEPSASSGDNALAVSDASASTSDNASLEATPPPATINEEVAAPDPQPGPESDTEDDGEWSVGAFSEHEADHFADSMRASWDVTTAEAEPAWAAAVSTPAAEATTKARTPIAPSFDTDDLPPVALAKGFDRRVIVAAGGLLLMFVLIVWSLSGGEPEAPPSWSSQAGSTEPQAPAAPSEAPAAPPAPTETAPSTALPTRASEPTAPRIAPTVQANAPPTSAPRDVPAKSVHVRISTVPASAELKLDGETVPNPFDAWVARGGEHTIVATADGYAENDWSVSFDRDQTLSLALKPEAVRRPAARRARRATAKKPATQVGSRPRGAGFVTDNPY